MPTQRHAAAPMAGIAEQIRRARMDRSWTQAELAEHASVSRPTIARIERGDDVSTATLAKVAGSLDLTLSISHERGQRP